MSDPFVAEIRIFAGNFAPVGWAFCNGQVLSISQNTALFSLLGTTYGGDGRSTFALPDLRARTPMQWGQGPGLSLRDLGESGGEETVSLLASEMPAHAHPVLANTDAGDQSSPQNTVPSTARVGRQATNIYTATANTTMSPQALGVTGGGQPHNNLPPYLTLNFIIALQGIYPPRA